MYTRNSSVLLGREYMYLRGRMYQIHVSYSDSSGNGVCCHFCFKPWKHQNFIQQSAVKIIEIDAVHGGAAMNGTLRLYENRRCTRRRCLFDDFQNKNMKFWMTKKARWLLQQTLKKTIFVTDFDQFRRNRVEFPTRRRRRRRRKGRTDVGKFYYFWKSALLSRWRVWDRVMWLSNHVKIISDLNDNNLPKNGLLLGNNYKI